MDLRRDNRFYMPQQGEQFQYNNTSLSSPTAVPFSWRNHDNSPMEKEHMFDKVVTPSDVGKLNRLVIPKQYAEKYFPLNSAANEKGLLLSFEDRTGKSWRFRYSYWNSSQSYVMTKGWSRFVKEKRLDAGDTVSFGRGVGDAAARDRLFIDWHGRPNMIHINGHQLPGSFQLPQPNLPLLSRSVIDPWRSGGASSIVGGSLFVPPANPMGISCNNYHSHCFNGANLSSSGISNGQQLLYYRAPALTRAAAPLVLDSVPVAKNQVAAKRVRLFGVNLDCSESEEMGRDLQLQPAMSMTTLQLMEIPGASSSSSSTNKGRNLSFDLEL